MSILLNLELRFLEQVSMYLRLNPFLYRTLYLEDETMSSLVTFRTQTLNKRNGKEDKNVENKWNLNDKV